MSEFPFIKCLGCEEAVFDPTRAACPGCGRCPHCGKKRAQEVKSCPECNLPYCTCCGRCPQCLELRYTDIGPCECGHPNDELIIEKLVRYEAVVGAEKRPASIGCIVASITLTALFIWGLVSLKAWLH